MSPDRPPASVRRSRLRRAAGSAAAALALAAAASLAIAAPRSPTPQPATLTSPELPLPIRAAFYESRYPAAWSRSDRERPASGRYGTSVAVVKKQIAAMRYGGIAAGIAPFDGLRTLSASRVPVLLKAASGTPFRWGLRVTGSRFTTRRAETAVLSAVVARYGRRAAYLRLGGRPVVFMADSGRSCAAAGRWVAANRPWVYLVLTAFPGSTSCKVQPDGWYANDARLPAQAVLPYSFTIAPGRFPAGGRRPVLARDPDRFLQNVQAMVASGARFQLIDSFNRWEGGTAVENSRTWRTASGYGSYLDALHAAGATPAPAPPATGTAVPTIPAPVTPAVPTVHTPGAPAPAGPTTTATVPVTPPPPPPVTTDASTSPITPPPPPVTTTGTTTTTTPAPPPPPPVTGPDPVILAAGDIACAPTNAEYNDGQGTSNACAQQTTANMIGAAQAKGNLAAVLSLGDTQYEAGEFANFMQVFDKSWGKYKSLIHPAVGNHEYITPNGTGYFQYFGAAAGAADQGYYSFDVGSWHLIALNTNCSQAGGCSSGSPQGQWLKADLAAHKNKCVLAYFHIPLFSSGGRAEVNSKTLWQILYAANADVILSAHDHLYERFAPQTPDGIPDPVRGIRTFVVGTGGANHTSFVNVFPNSEVRNDDTYGLLQMTLKPGGYDWSFLPVPGRSFTDAGSGTCH